MTLSTQQPPVSLPTKWPTTMREARSWFSWLIRKDFIPKTLGWQETTVGPCHSPDEMTDALAGYFHIQLGTHTVKGQAEWFCCNPLKFQLIWEFKRAYLKYMDWHKSTRKNAPVSYRLMHDFAMSRTGALDHFIDLYLRPLAVSAAHLPKTDWEGFPLEEKLPMPLRCILAYLRLRPGVKAESVTVVWLPKPSKGRIVTGDPELAAALRCIRDQFQKDRPALAGSRQPSLHKRFGYPHIVVGASMVPTALEWSLGEVMACLPFGPLAKPWQGSSADRLFGSYLVELSAAYHREALVGLPRSVLYKAGPDGTERAVLGARKLKTIAMLCCRARDIRGRGEEERYHPLTQKMLRQAWSELSSERQLHGYASIDALLESEAGLALVGLEQRGDIPELWADYLDMWGFTSLERDALADVVHRLFETPRIDPAATGTEAPASAEAFEEFTDAIRNYTDFEEVNVKGFPYDHFPAGRRRFVIAWMVEQFHLRQTVAGQERMEPFDRYIMVLCKQGTLVKAAEQFHRDLAGKVKDAVGFKAYLGKTVPFTWLKGPFADQQSIELYELMWQRATRVSLGKGPYTDFEGVNVKELPYDYFPVGQRRFVIAWMMEQFHLRQTAAGQKQMEPFDRYVTTLCKPGTSVKATEQFHRDLAGEVKDAIDFKAYLGKTAPFTCLEGPSADRQSIELYELMRQRVEQASLSKGPTAAGRAIIPWSRRPSSQDASANKGRLT